MHMWIVVSDHPAVQQHVRDGSGRQRLYKVTGVLGLLAIPIDTGGVVTWARRTNLLGGSALIELRCNRFYRSG